MKCPKCGKEIANDSVFCEYCGNPIRKSHKKVIWITFITILVLLIGWASFQMGVQSGGHASATEGVFVDLGLPSGTLWKSVNEDFYYTYDEAVEQYENMLPTKEQYEELKENSNWSWTGNGYKITGPNGRSIVLPAAGYRNCNGDVMSYVRSLGNYWSSSPNGPEKAWELYFGSRNVYMDGTRRCYGQSVRLVQNN